MPLIGVLFHVGLPAARRTDCPVRSGSGQHEAATSGARLERSWKIELVANRVIRQAKAADYECIISVTNQWWDRDVSPGLPRLFLDHFWNTSLVVEEAAAVTGFLIGFHSPSEAETAYVHYIAVSPSARRSGVGRQLYGTFFDQARQARRRVVRAITSASNTDSIAFHRAIGFTVSDPLPDYNGPGRPAVKFELPLI